MSPGLIETTRDPVHFSDYECGFEERRLRNPVRRLETLADVAAARLFPASEASGDVTGRVLHVNGGEFIA